MRYFTADTHFNHKLLATIRGFSTTEAHDECLISIWNAYVNRKDEVYHLGDFCFGSHEVVRQLRHRLNGKIHLILGNHDKANRIQNVDGLFTSVNTLTDISIEKNTVVLCHYAMRTWRKSHFNSWQLYGHSHGGLTPRGKQHDVGVDANQMCLLSEHDIVHLMNNKENNENFLLHHKEKEEE